MAQQTFDVVNSDTCNAICNQLALVLDVAREQGLTVYLEYAHPLSSFSVTVQITLVDLVNCIVYGIYNGEQPVSLSCSFVDANAITLIVF